MIYFPANLKPVVNEGYSFGTPDNVLSIETIGGSPIQVLDYKYAPVTVGITIVGNRLTKMVMSDFYYGKISSGADKFYMNLDTGMGIEEHIVQIVPQSMNFNGGQDPLWMISFTARAERTPAQDAPYGGNLSDLYAVYGENIDLLFDALNQFVNVELPEYF